MAQLSPGDRVAWMMGIPPWVETLRVADALEDQQAIDDIRRLIVLKIKQMYDIDVDAAIRRYNLMMEARWPGLDHIRSTEVEHVRAGL